MQVAALLQSLGDKERVEQLKRDAWRVYIGRFNGTTAKLDFYKVGQKVFNFFIRSVFAEQTTALDGAFATGVSWLELAETCPSLKIIHGFDLMPEAIDEAWPIAKQLEMKDVRVRLTCHNVIEEWPYDDNSIDLGFLRLIICYLEGDAWKLALDQLLRVLAPGGWGYISFADAHFSFREWAGTGHVAKVYLDKEPKEVTQKFELDGLPCLMIMQELADAGLITFPDQEEVAAYIRQLGFMGIWKCEYHPNIWAFWFQKPLSITG